MLIFWLIAAFTWNGIQFDVCSRKGYRTNHVWFFAFQNQWIKWLEDKIRMMSKSLDSKETRWKSLVSWAHLNWLAMDQSRGKKLHFIRITKNRSSMSIMHSLTYRQIWLRSQLFDLLISLIPSSVPYNCVFVKENCHSSQLGHWTNE